MDIGAEELFFSGDSFFDRLVVALRAVQESVDVQSYIFANDTCGETIAEELSACARRGVRVRVLVDGFGSGGNLSHLASLFRDSGVAFRVYHPMRVASLLRAFLGISGESIFKVFGRFNRRNHRKVFVIDRREAFLGSMNVTDVHLKRYSKGESWKDVGLYISGDRVSDLVGDFNRVWNGSEGSIARRIHGAFSGRKPRFPERVLLNTTFRYRYGVRDLLLRHIRSTEREIYIANAYVVPVRRIVRALCAAARRGVDVRLMVGERSDVPLVPHVAAGYYRYFLKAGARVYQYKPSVLHAKTMIADDWAIVGSSNLNHRSLLHDLEVDVVLSQEENRERLREEFHKDLSSCTEFTMAAWQARPWWSRMVGAIGFYFRYWL